MARAVWLCIRGGSLKTTRPTRRTAQRYFERPYWPGNCLVRNSKTGETWERRSGSWYKTVEARQKAAS